MHARRLRPNLLVHTKPAGAGSRRASQIQEMTDRAALSRPIPSAPRELRTKGMADKAEARTDGDTRWYPRDVHQRSTATVPSLDTSRTVPMRIDERRPNLLDGDAAPMQAGAPPLDFPSQCRGSQGFSGFRSEADNKVCCW